MLCVRRPHPPRLDACIVTELWAECGGDVGLQAAIQQRFHGATAHRTGHHGRDLPAVRAPPLTHLVWTRASSPGCGLSAVAMWVCRMLFGNDFTGTLPTELGTLTALMYLCVRRPHPPCLDACTVIGL